MEAEQVLQKKLDHISEELREAQDGSTTLQAQVDAAKEQAKTLTGQYTHIFSFDMNMSVTLAQFPDGKFSFRRHLK